MLIALLACVTAESFPRMYADDLCAWWDVCASDQPTCTDAGRSAVEDDIRAVIDADGFNREQAVACLDEIEAATEAHDCGNPLRACDGL
jgi:hypothetical protein